MEYYSPLRYPGGKNKAVPLFKKVIDVNNLRGGVYVEPFAGGSSVALALLIDGYVKRVVINDADPSIYAFWFSCLNQNDLLCELINAVEISIEQRSLQKDIYQTQRNAALEGKNFDILKLGFSTFYLNRTNRSGILKGGVVGGVNQSGKYRIDARFHKEDLIRRIHQVGLLTDRIELHNQDAKQFLLNNHQKWPSNTLVYCDPPYVKKGKGLYMNFFTKENHKALSDTIFSLERLNWVITYDIDPLIADIYQNYRINKMALSYSAQTHTSKAEEFIIFSDQLIIPEHPKIVKL